MKLFRVGDLVSWPTRKGWQQGEIVDLFATTLPIASAMGRTRPAQSLQLMIRTKDGQVLGRDIRSCAGSHPGPLIVPAKQKGEAA